MPQLNSSSLAHTCAQHLAEENLLLARAQEDKFGDEVFLRVERTFCCGLQSNDPATRQKFFRLYSDRIHRELFDRLRYIIQYQDWDFLAHTFWLKHAVVSPQSYLTSIHVPPPSMPD
jgi:hypothetical protein